MPVATLASRDRGGATHGAALHILERIADHHAALPGR
jgi:hypothetical protein